MQRRLQECWRSAQRWRTLISAAINISESLAAVLAQCAALAHLDLGLNSIGPDGAEQGQRALQDSWGCVQRWLTLISATIRPKHTGQSAWQECWRNDPALAHLNLGGNECYNGIGAGGAESLARVLVQCEALACLNIEGDDIGAAGAVSLAGVLALCPAHAHLNLSDNGIEAVGGGRLRASWRGQSSGLLF